MVDEAVVQKFRSLLRGGLLLPGDSDYDQARKIWNGMIDRRPAMIVRCAGPADVISAVQFARENPLPVAVRGGGHSAAGKAMCDGGLVMDLSPMKGIRVDPAARTARARGGVTWRDLDHETHPFGLATNGGVISSTGIAGLPLGGGIAWLRALVHAVPGFQRPHDGDPIEALGEARKQGIRHADARLDGADVEVLRGPYKTPGGRLDASGQSSFGPPKPERSAKRRLAIRQQSIRATRACRNR